MDASREFQENPPPNMGERAPNKMARIKENIHRQYSRVPFLRKLPPRSVAIIILLIFVNLLVWAAVGVVLNYHSYLSGTAILAYTFGLRHALDADHISAIDLMTRRLVAAGQQPVTVGTFFSLGHSTIVIITSIVVAATASAISEKFNTFSRIGGIIGSSISAAFLLILGAANAYILYMLIRQMKRILQQRISTPSNEEQAGQVKDEKLEWKIEGGVLFKLFRKLFRFIDRPWKMYPLGILFGLGFDTSSEVALLGIASIQGAHGTSLWLILIFPVLFTAGMCLIDTMDGALMLALYTSAGLARDTLAILYYNVGLTCLTVIVAIVIGVLQVLGLVVAVVGDKKLTQNGSPAARRFWRGVEAVGDRYDVVGGCICGLFVVVGVGSVLFYPRWRKWIDSRWPPRNGGTPDKPDSNGCTEKDQGLKDNTATDVLGEPEKKSLVTNGVAKAPSSENIKVIETDCRCDHDSKQARNYYSNS